MLDRTGVIRVFAAFVLTAAAVSLTACGDDDGNGDPGGTLTKTDYLEQGDAICQELYKQRDPLEVEAARAAQEGDAARAADVFENAAEITENRLAELEELPVPAGDEEAVQRVIQRGEETVETARAAAAAIRAEDSKALARESAAGRRITARFNKAAIEYGFFVCGRGVQATIG